MRLMVCRTSMSLVYGDEALEIAPGRPVDFDRVLVPAAEGRPAYTLEHAVAGREELFEPAPGTEPEDDGARDGSAFAAQPDDEA